MISCCPVDGDTVNNDDMKSVSALQDTPLGGISIDPSVTLQDPVLAIPNPLNLANGGGVTPQYWFTEESVIPQIDPLLAIRHSDSNSCSSSSTCAVAPDESIHSLRSIDSQSTWPRGVSIDQIMDVTVPASLLSSQQTLIVESNAKRKERTDPLLHHSTRETTMKNVSDYPLGLPSPLCDDISLPSIATENCLSLLSPHQTTTDTRTTPSSPLKKIRKDFSL